ncbi:MAG: nicotinate-nicotinamide nucleotide adenylyltransferase [Brevinema sp.]
MHNIFIFGGSFDPIHQGHEDLIRSALPFADELRIVPAGSHPDGKKYFFSDEERLLLVKAALGLLSPEDFPNADIASGMVSQVSSKITLSTVELFSQKRAYTIDLLHFFIKEDDKSQYNLIVGADQAQYFSRWKDASEISCLVKLWTVPRAGFNPDHAYEWNFLPFKEKDISSTIIRECLLQNIPCEHVSPIVLRLAHHFMDKKKMF